MSGYSGFLISLEGLDYSGKSTIAQVSTPFIERELNQKVICLREPGGTEIGEKIRTLVHDSRHEGKISILTEALLYQAARAQIVEEVIRPKLDEGYIVVLDRFRDSSTEYQGVGRGLGINEIEALNDFSTQKLLPNLTLLFDIPVSVMRKRQAENIERESNRMDNQTDEFYEKIRHQYLKVAQNNYGQRWKIIDATIPLPEVWQVTQEILRDKIFAHLYQEGQTRQNKER